MANETIHGLQYPQGLFDTLPVLLSRPAPHTPIRQLNAEQLAALHLRAQLAHAPDGVLFPFLHGLEGANDAQNSFFQTGFVRQPNGTRGPAKVPRFRGLIYVGCEDDEGESESDEEVFEDSEDDDEDVETTFAMDEDKYMHPLATRSPSDASSSLSSPPSPTFTAASYASTAPTSAPSSPSPSHADCPTPMPFSQAMLPKITSTFRAKELLDPRAREGRFLPVSVPDGISLRNFGIQVPIYATLSDIVVYSRRADSRRAFALAEKFKQAVEAKAEERAQAGAEVPVAYNVFVLDAPRADVLRHLGHALQRTVPHAPHTDGTDAHTSNDSPLRPDICLAANTVNFAQREKDEMRDLTRASEILSTPSGGSLWLGNAADVPLAPPSRDASPFDSGPNVSEQGRGYDVCVECHDRAPMPAPAHLRAAEEHLTALAAAWSNNTTDGKNGAPRPAPHPGAVVHLPFPSSPAGVGSVSPFLEFLARVLGPQPNGARPAKVLVWSADGYTESSVLALCAIMAGKGLGLPEAYLELQVERRRSFFVYQSDLGVLRRVEAKLARERRIAAGTQEAPELGAPDGRSVAGGWGNSKGSGHAHSATLPGSLPSNYNYNSAYAEDMVVDTSPSTASPDDMAPSSAPAMAAPILPNPLASSASQPLPPTPPATVPSQLHLHAPRRPRASTSPMLGPAAGDHGAWFDDPRFDGSFPSRVLPFLYLGNLNHASNAYMLHALGITHVVSVGECALVPPSGPSTCPSPSSSAPGPGIASPLGHIGRRRQGSLYIEEREGRIKVLDIKGVCDDGIDTLEPQLAPICDWIERARCEGGKVLVHCRVGVSRSATVTIAYVMKHLALPLVDAYLIVRSRRLSVLIQPNMRLLYNLLGWEVRLALERAAAAVSQVSEASEDKMDTDAEQMTESAVTEALAASSATSATIDVSVGAVEKEGGMQVKDIRTPSPNSGRKIVEVGGARVDEDVLRAEMARALSWPYLAREVHRLNEKYLH
ncbi:hypothetical protein PENSPDRAFT_667139 [Peniophora sp. CONT]|nr:hypothetical protein PENSPDRAFT_667139 [Peniophora sp. CONT]